MVMERDHRYIRVDWNVPMSLVVGAAVKPNLHHHSNLSNKLGDDGAHPHSTAWNYYHQNQGKTL